MITFMFLRWPNFFDPLIHQSLLFCRIITIVARVVINRLHGSGSVLSILFLFIILYRADSNSWYLVILFCSQTYCGIRGIKGRKNVDSNESLRTRCIRPKCLSILSIYLVVCIYGSCSAQKYQIISITM